MSGVVQMDSWGRERPVMAPAGVARPPLPALDLAACIARIDQLQRRIERLEAQARHNRARQVQTGHAPPARSGVPTFSTDWTRRLAIIVADHWEVPVMSIWGTGRKAVVCRPRFVLTWLVRNVASCSYPQVATSIGYLDHTSVMHACRRVDQWRAAEEDFAGDTDKLLVIARRLHAERFAAKVATLDARAEHAEAGQ